MAKGELSDSWELTKFKLIKQCYCCLKYQCPVVWSVEENTKRKKPKDRKKPVKKNWCFYWSDGKNSRFVKEQEANRLLSRLGLKTISSKIRLFGGILFSRYRINKIVNRFLLRGDTFKPD